MNTSNFNYWDISLQEYPNEICLVLYHDKCNLNCDWCFNSSRLFDNELSFSQAKKAIDETKDFITAVCLSGGEPSLSPYYMKIIKYCNDLGLKVKVNTNSVEYNPYYYGKSNRIDYLNISFKPKYIYDSIKNNNDIILSNIMKNTFFALDFVEWSFVYHKWIQDIDTILLYMNRIIKAGDPKQWFSDYRPDILTINQLNVGECLNTQFNDYKPPTRDELIEFSKQFEHIPRRKIIIETKEFGRETIFKT